MNEWMDGFFILNLLLIFIFKHISSLLSTMIKAKN